MVLYMTATQIHLCERLKRLGFSRQSQIRLYGSQFELVGDPLVISEDGVLWTQLSGNRASHAAFGSR